MNNFKVRQVILAISVVAMAIVWLIVYNVWRYNNSVFIFNDIEYTGDDAYFSEYTKSDGVFMDKDLDTRFVKYSLDMNEFNNINWSDRVYYRMNHISIPLTVNYIVDEDALKDYITNDYNKNRLNPVNAKIIKSKKKFAVTEGKYGTKIDSSLLIKDIDEGKKHINIADYRLEPDVTSNDLRKKLNKLNKYAEWYCKYDKDTVLKSSSEYIEFDDDYNPILNYDFIDDFISSIAVKYDTVGDSREFKTSDGNIISISGGTFGNKVDQTKEREFLVSRYDSGKSVKKHSPTYSMNMSKIGDDYIEISIPKQHLWVYKDGRCINQSDVVTGKNSVASRRTPTGVYYMMERIPGKTLNPSGGGSVWVDRWMRVTTSGVGLHDASWRGAFGGNIYLGNGSHGCINLPKTFAYWLYDNSSLYEPIIIY